MIVLQFADGTIGTINNSCEAPCGYDQRVEVFGSRGIVEIRNASASSAVISTKDGLEYVIIAKASAESTRTGLPVKL